VIPLVALFSPRQSRAGDAARVESAPASWEFLRGPDVDVDVALIHQVAMAFNLGV